MAYTRSLVAGFDIDNIDDLVYFANAFGASRLRYVLEICNLQVLTLILTSMLSNQKIMCFCVKFV